MSYAITFDMDTGLLDTHYPGMSYTNAYYDIRKTLEKYGFKRQQGSVYFGDKEAVDNVTCVLAVQDLTTTFPWFSLCVKDIRMLRIEEDNDLRRAIDKALMLSRGNKP